MKPTRSYARGQFFLHLAGRLRDSERRRFEAALCLLEPEHHRALFDAHLTLDRESVDWKAEERAVDRLTEALGVLIPPPRVETAA